MENELKTDQEVNTVGSRVSSDCSVEDLRSNQISRVYLELCEVRGWWNVKTHKEGKYAFISGRPTRHEPRQLVLPLSSHEMVSPMQMQEYLQEIKLDDSKTDGLTLAICEPDTTTVYYKITNGLVQPEDPVDTDMKKQERYQVFQKRKIDLNNYVIEYNNRLKLKKDS